MVTTVRYPGGVTNTAPFQALGQMGQPNPFFYHTVADDFDAFIPAVAAGAAGTSQVAAVNVTAAGTGYTSAPTVGFSGGGGTGAAGVAILSGTTVAAVVVTNPGTGYTSVPAVAFTGGAGTGAAATAIITPAAGASAASSGTWVATANGAGTAPANIAANGGVIQFVTGATTGNNYTLTKPAASFLLTGTTDAGNNPKTFFYVSLNTAAIASATILTGLINTSTNPIATPPTDGIWFSKAFSGGIAINYRSATGTILTATLPAAAYILANSSFIDLAFSVTPQGSILAWAGANSIGYIPQSGSGANTPAPLYPTVRLTPTLPLTSVLLNPTITVAAGSAAAQTVQIDYVLAAQER